MKILAVVAVALLAVLGFDSASILYTRHRVTTTARSVAVASLQTMRSTNDTTKARAAADTRAQHHHDVVTGYHYDPVTQELSVTVSGSAPTLLFHHLDRSLTDEISASAGARP